MPLNFSNYNDTDNKIWSVNVSGEIDIYTAKDFKENLISLLNEEKKDIILDFKDLLYIDSTGIGVIIGTYRQLRGYGKKIKIINSKPNVIKLFTITGLDEIFLL